MSQPDVVYVVAVEGSSSTELSAYTFDTSADAEDFRAASEGEATQPIAIPRGLADHPAFLSALIDILSAVAKIGL